MLAMNSPRRVLADKPTNISIRKQDSSKNFVRTESLDVSFGSALSHSSEGRRSSHKRRFDEMAGEQEVGESQDSTATQQISLFGSQNSNTSLGDDADTDSRNLTRSTAPTTMISFQVSQTEPNPMETEFEIHEEMSQQTLDKIHAVTFSQPTSQPFLRPSLAKETSAVSVSLSSLIDFDQDKSSQGSDGLQQSDGRKEDEHTLGSASATTKDARTDFLIEKAATLRTKLQLAFYKVQTSQTSMPFSRLRVPSESKSPEPFQPEIHSSSPLSSPYPGRQTNTSFGSRIVIEDARSTINPRPPGRPLDDLVAPSVESRTFSARWNEQHTEPPASDGIPSSPPLSHGSETLVRDQERTSTPPPYAMSKKGLPHTPVQLSSPPGSPTNVRNTVKRIKREGRYGGLTSSVVKGEAASSLLELGKGGID